MVRAERRRRGVPSVVQLLSYEVLSYVTVSFPCDGKRSSSPLELCPLRGPTGARMQFQCPAPASGLWQDVKVLSTSSQLPGVAALTICLQSSPLHPSPPHFPTIPHDCCLLPSSLHSTPTFHLGCILFPSTLHLPSPTPTAVSSPPPCISLSPPPQPQPPLLQPTVPSLPYPNCCSPTSLYPPS